MATIIPASKEDIYVEDVAYKRSASEALFRKMGAAINYINSKFVYTAQFNFGGFFRPTSIDQVSECSYFNNDVSIDSYTMEISVTAAGNHKINFKVINTAGTELGNLFTTAPNINGAGKVNSVVGYDYLAASAITRNIAGLTTNNGTIDPSYFNVISNKFIIPKGYSLRAFVEEGSGSAQGCYFTLFLGVLS